MASRTEARSASSSSFSEPGPHRGDTGGPSESERLRRKIGLVWPVLASAGRGMLTHPRAREIYGEYLATFHGIVRASVPLMRAAVDRARTLPDDEVAGGLALYLEPHISEEMDHDEWVLEDLEVLGVDREGVLARPPAPAVAELVGAQYYWILHYHPIALLGYMTLLEAYPPRVEAVEELIARTGYERSAFRTLLHHADQDPHHAAELCATIDALPLTPDQSAVLGVSALSTVYLLTRVVAEIVSRADAASRPATG